MPDALASELVYTTLREPRPETEIYTRLPGASRRPRPTRPRGGAVMALGYADQCWLLLLWHL
jgi:hypothetical protein